LSSETAHPRVAIIDKRKIFWAEKADSTRLDSGARGAKLSPRRFSLRAAAANTVDKNRAVKVLRWRRYTGANRSALNRPAQTAAMFCRSSCAAQPNRLHREAAGPPVRACPAAASRLARHKAAPSGEVQVSKKSAAADCEIMIRIIRNSINSPRNHQ
jgi:hypothetical protein